jgi:hypothetical protein
MNIFREAKKKKKRINTNGLGAVGLVGALRE